MRDKVEAINNIKHPQNRREVERLLGMVGYYRMFIPRFSEIMAPLTDLSRGPRKRTIQWTNECEAVFKTLQRALSQPPVLTMPDFNLPIIVHTDASGQGLGAVQSQEKWEQEKPILFLSRKLSLAKMKYSTIECKALAIKWAVNTLQSTWNSL